MSLFEMSFPPVVLWVYMGFVGVCMGSFANVVGYRLPRGESLVKPPSHSPACGHKLSPLDLVPVFGWVLLGGKCRYCKGKISVRYPLVEFLCGGLFVSMAVYAGWEWRLIPLCMFALTLLCVTLCDMDTQTIPDGLCIFGAAWGLLWLMGTVAAPHLFPPLTGGGTLDWWQDALLGAFCGAFPLFAVDRITLLVAKKDAFGYGDVKLMAMVGLFLGWQRTLIALLFGIVLGGIAGVFVLRRRKEEGGTYMPFGPCLALGSLLSLWVGLPVAQWYANALVN